MKCNNCGTENSNENKFCVSCGTELKNLKKDHIYCGNCGSENNKESNYCDNCGSRLLKPGAGKAHHQNKSNQSRKNKRVRQRKLTFVDLWKENKAISVVGLLIIGFIIIQILPGEKTERSNRGFTADNRSLAGFAGSRLNDLASKFICSCGSCGEQPLEVCTCPTAKEERAFIQSMINNNSSDAEIIKTVNNKYGWIKPQFRNLLNSGAASATANNAVNVNVQAGVKDRNYIISQFECPCGQCGIDELIECGCDHPNGAKEVKGFIDQQIAVQKFTVKQIINNVNSRYGGLKI